MDCRSPYTTSAWIACLTLAASLFAGSRAAAQTDYYWNVPGGGGTAAWDTVTQNWTTTAVGGVNDYTWTSSGAERANFGNTAGTVTLATGITAYGLNFASDGYIISGNTLTLAGTGGVIDTGGVNATINSAIAGTVGLTKNSSGILTLGSANTYTGGTTINAGVIAVGNNTALGGTATGTTVASGAAIQVSGGLTGVTQPVTLNGNGILSGGAIRNTSGNNIWSGVITVGASGARINSDAGTLTISSTIAAGSSGHALTIGGAGNVSISQSINNLGAGALNMDGSGMVTLASTGSSTWSGPVTISNGGTISFSNQTAFGVTGTVTLDNGKIQETNGAANGSFISATRNIVLNAGGGTLEYTTAGTLIIVQTNTVISGVGGLNKTGTGIISVVTPATYQGPTHVIAGTLRVRTNNNVYPTGTALSVDSGATFDLANLSQQVGSLSGSGSVTTGSGTFTVGDSSSTSFSGVISGTSGKLTKAGSGTLTLSGANTYTGATTINAGTLQYGIATALPTGASAANVTVNTGGTLDLAGLSPTINGLAGTSGIVLNSTASTTSNLTVGNNNATASFAGVIKDNAGTGGTTGLTKIGNGTQTLSGANTYTGVTGVSVGTLALSGSGSISSSSLISVGLGATFDASGATAGLAIGPGQTLTGSGTVVGNSSIVNGGTLLPGGSSPGTLIIGAGTHTWSPGGTYDFRYDQGATPPGPVQGGANNDLLQSAATITTLDLSSLSAAQQFNLDLIPFPGTPQGGPVTYTIADFSPSTATTKINLPPSIVGTDLTPFFHFTGSFSGTPSASLAGGGSEVQVTFTPIPEPGSLALVCGGVAALAAWRRRNRNAKR
jgi:autotransporter-associated beta strand protein